MIAATNPDTGAITWGYLAGEALFAALIVAGLLYAAWRANGGTVESWLDQQIARRRRRARQELADPILAVHRGRRPTRRAVYVPQQLDAANRPSNPIRKDRPA